MSGKIHFKRAFTFAEGRMRRSKGFRRRWNMYETWQGKGEFYKRGNKEEKRKFLGYICGERGEWYKVIGIKTNEKDGPYKTRELAALSKRRSKMGGRAKPPTRKYFGVRRGYGDDKYSWTVYDKSTDKTIIDGESRHQAGWYADKFERERVAKIKDMETQIETLKSEIQQGGHSEDVGSWKHELSILLCELSKFKPCGCREPKSHASCVFCGYYYLGPVVCGLCAESGIDHDEDAPNRGIIKGTERRVCKSHQLVKETSNV